MSRYDDVEAKCPFYKTGSYDELKCEGLKESLFLLQHFENKAKRNSYKCKHCDSEYRSCEIFKMLEKKYE